MPSNAPDPPVEAVPSTSRSMGPSTPRGRATTGGLRLARMAQAVQMPSAAALEDGLASYGQNEPQTVPIGAQALVGFDLTTHEGHFMGAGRNRLLRSVDHDVACVRAGGTWDPTPWHIEQAYGIGGREAQHAFWGQGNIVAQSLLDQLALQITP